MDAILDNMSEVHAHLVANSAVNEALSPRQYGEAQSLSATAPERQKTAVSAMPQPTPAVSAMPQPTPALEKAMTVLQGLDNDQAENLLARLQALMERYLAEGKSSRNLSVTELAAILQALNIKLSAEESRLLLGLMEDGWLAQRLALLKRYADEGMSVEEAMLYIGQLLAEAEAWLMDLRGGISMGQPDGVKWLATNLNIQELGDGLLTDNMQAIIRGGLASNTGGTGIYQVNFNLKSGYVDSSFMRGKYGSSTYDLSGGGGRVQGNSFNLTGFSGTAVGPGPGIFVDGSLTGTAAKGFDNLGDIGASGTYKIYDAGTDPNVLMNVRDSGTISSGERIK